MASTSAPAVVIGEELRIPADVFELRRYRLWARSFEYPVRGRVSFLAGRIEVDMSPEEIETHNKLKTAITHGLCDWVRRHDIGDVLSDGALVVNVEADLATEPDLTVCRWDSLRAGRVRYEESSAGSGRYMEVLGAPDLIVEIVSQSSLRKDTVLLRERYHKAGVDEYWLLDARGAAIEFHLLARTDGEFQETAPEGEGYRVSRVLGGAFRLVRDRNPVGGYRYSLLTRAKD